MSEPAASEPIAERATISLPRQIDPFFLILFAVGFLWVVRATVLFRIDLAIPEGSWRWWYSTAWKVAIFVLPAYVYLRLRGRSSPSHELGLSRGPSLAGGLEALAATGVYMAAMVVIAVRFEGKVFQATGQSAYSQVLTNLVTASPSALSEEVLFRGLILPELTERWGSGKATLATALLFAAIHLPHWLWVRGMNAGVLMAMLSVTILGVFLCWLRRRTRSLWPSVAAHVANNVISSFLV